MENKYIKYLNLSVEDINLISSDLERNTVSGNSKWLTYLLMATALVLWIIFNIVAIQSYQFATYPLVVMNLILYCILAVMANPNYSTEPPKKKS